MNRLQTTSSLSTASDVVEEIRLLRQSYLQHGGGDIAILMHLADLEKEASAAEQKSKASPAQHHSGSDHWPIQNNRHIEQTPVISDQKMSSDMNQVRKLDQLEERLQVAEGRAAVEKLRRSLNEIQLQLPKQNPLEVAATLVAESGALFEKNLLYNSSTGFVILYDFVTGLLKETTSIQLSVALYVVSKEIGHYGQPVFLDPVYTVPTGDHMMSRMAFMGAKQPVTQCLPHIATCLIIELMTSSSYSTPVTCAWCRVDLFDKNGHFLSGQWRMPFLKLPIQPQAKTSSLAKFGLSEVCVRLEVSTASSMMSLTHPSTETYLTTQMAGQKVRKAPEQLTSNEKSDVPLQAVDSDIITVQVIRVKGAEPITFKLRLTAYHRKTGRVVKSSSLAPFSCVTTTVDSKYRHSCHIFGQQEASFNGVRLEGDEMLVARLFRVNDDAIKYKAQTYGRGFAGGVDCDGGSSVYQMSRLSLEEDEETRGESLVAWGVLLLVASQKKDQQSSQGICLNAGTHVITLFCPPVPDFGWPESMKTTRKKERYQRATLRLKISRGKPRPGSVTPSEESDDSPSPETAWLLCERKSPPSEPFTATDGFDLYIDGCRSLPENVSVTRISASVLDKQYSKVGRAMSCISKLDSDIHNPIYAYRVEFREPAMPATSTLIIKIYTIDPVSNSSVIVGYALLNIFVETGTVRQPVADAGMQVSLNEGGHQLRIYHQGPEGNEPLSKSCIADRRHVPCATVLIRLVRAARGPQGKSLEADRVPHADWLKLGLLCPMPRYADCVYYSSRCRPGRGERLLLDAMQRQTRVTVREVLQHGVAQPKDLKKYQTDAELDTFLQKRFTEIMDKSPRDYDLTFITPFSPRHGIKVSLDEARNIPWPNFTEALICCNPPAAFYKDTLHQTAYDKPFFTRMLDLSSTNRQPVWNDGFFHLNYRSYQKFLTIIIQLKEIEVKITPVGYKYSLGDEAWTAIQVFNENFVYTSHYQLPLIQGSPSADDLHCLEVEALNDWLSRSLRTSKINLVPEASVMVRLCDGRRDDELPTSSPDGIKTKLNVEYLSMETRTSYQTNGTGRPLLSMLPDGKRPEEFADNLANRFKRLVYKVHMEENDEE